MFSDSRTSPSRACSWPLLRQSLGKRLSVTRRRAAGPLCAGVGFRNPTHVESQTTLSFGSGFFHAANDPGEAPGLCVARAGSFGGLMKRSAMWPHGSLFTRASLKGHLGCFQVLTARNQAICIQSLRASPRFHFSWVRSWEGQCVRMTCI